MINQNEAYGVFCEEYSGARTEFCDLAQKLGAEVHRFEHPLSETSQDGGFGIDTARFGPPDATKLLVMISGTHGPELLAGTAMQLHWMRNYSSEREDDEAVLLIHAANAYGCAHVRRTTENNVDLNRNFCDFASSPKGTELSRSVQHALCRSSKTGPNTVRAMLDLRYLSVRHGKQAVVEEIASGQSFRPDGIGYGGTEPEWANKTIKLICEAHFTKARKIAIIDWHTGIGSYAEPSFLCFDEIGSPEIERARLWFGERAANNNADFASGERPSYRGLLVRAVQDIAKRLGAETTALVIEFGTYSNTKMLTGLLYDRWLQNPPKGAKSSAIAEIESQLSKLFYPTDPKWRESVLRNGDQIISETLNGLGKW